MAEYKSHNRGKFIIMCRREDGSQNDDNGNLLYAMEEYMNISTIYTRWGKTTCPSHADTVYSGFVGGSYYGNKGGAAEPLCMPKDPEWGIYTDGTDGSKSYLYGAEYEVDTLTDSRKSLHDQDVPCTVSRQNCYDGWSKEYQGYLMADYHSHYRASKFVCVDENPESLYGSRNNSNGYLLYAVEGICGSLPCPPYVNGRELTCAVCSF
ncbi:hypothetical protein FSP39_016111 [Pinctada imbricata]|uniref:Uncharacterized protein n=1 Tax=Pinctada imbricata TaxID=66713 RepID=A0AA89BU67_PINIB|nr:hypothetical protein FSP39_016111 [Pinctada imbricata]